MSDSKLKSKINGFYHAVINQMKLYIENGFSFKVKHEETIHIITNFSYDKGRISYSTSPKIIEKEKLDYMECNEFIVKYCYNLHEYDELFTYIKSNYQIKDLRLPRLIEKFIFKIISKYNKDISNNIKEKYIRIFLNYLEGRANQWKVKAWIDGLVLEKEDFILIKDIKIRRLRADDIEFYEEQGSYPRLVSDSSTTFPTTILEMKTMVTDQSEIYNEIKIITIAFRLFDLGSVFINKYILKPKSFLERGFYEYRPYILFKNRFEYEISDKDIPKINELITFINHPKIKNILLYKSGKPNYILIALQRYNNAFLSAENTESLITYAISCLEALYLKVGERQELSRRLSQRVSFTLKLFGFDPLIINKIIKIAYSVRSTYSHGSIISVQKSKLNNLAIIMNRKEIKLNDIARMVLDCARISILIFLQLQNVINKKKFLNLIDEGLLEEKSTLKLNNLIEKNCSIWPNSKNLKCNVYEV